MNISVREQFNRYMRRAAMAASKHCYSPGSLFYGAEGAKRLARECGPALLDFGEYGYKNANATYGAICVIAYQLMPPINAREWYESLMEGYERAKEWREVKQA